MSPTVTTTATETPTETTTVTETHTVTPSHTITNTIIDPYIITMSNNIFLVLDENIQDFRGFALEYEFKHGLSLSSITYKTYSSSDILVQASDTRYVAVSTKYESIKDMVTVDKKIRVFEQGSSPDSIEFNFVNLVLYMIDGTTVEYLDIRRVDSGRAMNIEGNVEGNLDFLVE